MSSHHQQGTWFALRDWLRAGLPLRAVICDIYGTLLTPMPPLVRSGRLWGPAQTAFGPHVQSPTPVNARLQALVREEHARSERPFPEVNWITLFGRCFPEIASRPLLARLARHHARSQRHCELAAGAAEFIHDCPVPLALCSNAQAYTLMELRLALRTQGLRLKRFDLVKSFFSYQHGTGKPNPEIFADLTQQWGGPPQELLMVGDRMDNDILPAQHAGWSTWHLVS